MRAHMASEKSKTTLIQETQQRMEGGEAHK